MKLLRNWVLAICLAFGALIAVVPAERAEAAMAGSLAGVGKHAGVSGVDKVHRRRYWRRYRRWGRRRYYRRRYRYRRYPYYYRRRYYRRPYYYRRRPRFGIYLAL